LGEEAPPQDELATLMRTMFGQRRDEKSEMIRRVQRGDPIQLACANFDADEVETHLGVIFDAGTSPESPRVLTPRAQPAVVPDARPTRTPWVAGVGLSAIALAAAIAAWWSGLGSSATSGVPTMEVAAEPRVAESPPTPPAIAVEPVRDPAPARAEPTEVAITIATGPPGATLRMDGADGGPTPVTFAVPAGDDEREVSVALDGYRASTQAFVPDGPRAFAVELEPRRPRSGRPSADRGHRPRTATSETARAPRGAGSHPVSGPTPRRPTIRLEELPPQRVTD
jgi:hypothetical protein